MSKKKKGVLAQSSASKGNSDEKTTEVKTAEAPEIKEVIKDQKEEKKQAEKITKKEEKTTKEVQVENSAKLNNLAANEKNAEVQEKSVKTSAKAEFYTRGQGTSWVPIKKDFGGSLEDVQENKFNYPLDMNSQGEILFSDGSIVEAENRQVRNGNYSELLKEVKTAQKKIDAAKKSKK